MFPQNLHNVHFRQEKWMHVWKVSLLIDIDGDIDIFNNIKSQCLPARMT